MREWVSISPQVQLTTALRSCRNVSEAQSQPHSCQISLLWARMITMPHPTRTNHDQYLNLNLYFSSWDLWYIPTAAPGMFFSFHDASHHPGKFAGELVQKIQQYQCFECMVIRQGETPLSDFPDFHILLHGDPLNTARDAGAELWWANPEQKLPLYFQQCLCNANTEQAGVSRREKDRLGRDLWETEQEKCFPWKGVVTKIKCFTCQQDATGSQKNRTASLLQNCSFTK